MSEESILAIVALLVVVVIAVVMIWRYRHRFSAKLEAAGVKAELKGSNKEEPGDGPAAKVDDSTKRDDRSGNVSIGGNANKATIVTGNNNKVGPSS